MGIALVLGALLAGLSWAQEAEGPSFDCARAATASEKAVCGMTGLAWYDRQMNRAYDFARKAVGTAGLPKLKAEQADFLETREACMGRADETDCLMTVYAGRVEQLARLSGTANFVVADYGAEFGMVSSVRYPDDSVALSISTIGEHGHTCTFETERARVSPNGAYRFSEKPGDYYEEACTLTATPQGDSLTIATRGDGCTYYCGMRATLEGTFTRIAH